MFSLLVLSIFEGSSKPYHHSVLVLVDFDQIFLSLYRFRVVP